MSAVVITNCTGRKRVLARKAALLPPSNATTLPALAKTWLQSINDADALQTIRDLYVGRSVMDSASVAQGIDAELMFVSAGLGLIDSKQQRPAYNLTVSRGDGSISPVLNRLGATAAEWWDEINTAQGRPHPLRALLLSRSTKLVLMALPSGYLEMVFNDIKGVSETALQKLRVFTSAPGVSSLPAHVRPCVMPYDKRLEATLPGTKGDFPQRAMRHFVEVLNGHVMNDLDLARHAVSKALGRLVAPVLPERAKLTDDEILSLLKRHWHHHGGQSSRLLRYLRDDALVACEQGRFRDLWHRTRSQIKSEMAHG